jgi:hypothetical protein
MWILDVHSRGSSSVRYYLTAGSYTLGRKDGCNIHIGGGGSAAADASISRLHATLHVMAVQAKWLEAVDHVPDCFVSDHSRHGTFVNNDRIASHEVQRMIGAGDIVRLGLDATVTLQYAPFILAASPRLTSFEYREVHSIACRLGAAMCPPTSQGEWHRKGSSAAAFLYVCNSIHEDDEALLFGLLYRYTLVTPEYLSALADLLRGTPHLPMARWPQPRGVPASMCRSLSDRHYFRPAPTFHDGDEFARDVPPQEPTYMFRTLRLLCLDDALWHKYHVLLAAGGGRMIKGRMQGRLVHDASGAVESSALPLESMVSEKADAHGFGTFVLVSSSDFRSLADLLEAHRQHDRDVLRQELEQPTKTPSTSASLLPQYFSLWEQGLRVIDEENIHAALYANDAAKEFHVSAPGVLCRAVMDDLPEAEANDSNATEDGILPYRPADAGCCAPSQRNTSPVRVCSAQQLSNHRADRPSKEATVASMLPRQLMIDSAPRASTSSAVDLYANWKETAKAHAVRNVSPTRRGPLPPSNVAQLRAPPVAAAVHVSPLRHRSPERAASSALGALAQDARVASPTRRGSALFRAPVSYAAIGAHNDQHLLDLCAAFEHDALARIAADTESACGAILRAGYVDGPCLAIIQDATATFTTFLKALSDAEKALPTALSTTTRRAAFRLREKIDTIQRAIRATHRAVGIATPAAMPSPRRYSSPSRPQSPSRRVQPPRAA